MMVKITVACEDGAAAKVEVEESQMTLYPGPTMQLLINGIAELRDRQARKN